MEDLISIIIVNWNWKKWLKKCFDTLLEQTYQNFEIIFVDNNSSDDSIEFLENNYKKYISESKIVIVKNNENSWFAWGNNLGYKYSNWEYILLLNNDTWVPKNYLSNFIKAFYEIPNLWSVQSKLVLMNDDQNLDACWWFWTNLTFLYHFWLWKNKDLPLYNKSFPVFSNKWASMMLKKEIIEKVWFFDDDFWCYYEETDLCHRIWISWYECWYYPEAVCYHAMWWTSLNFKNSFIEFHNSKNKLLSFLKNFEVKNLLYIVPTYIIISIGISFGRLLQWRFSHFIWIYKSFWWNIINFRYTLAKRKKIQQFRKKTDKEIFKITKKNPRLIYYIYLFINWTKLKNYEDKL